MYSIMYANIKSFLNKTNYQAAFNRCRLIFSTFDLGIFTGNRHFIFSVEGSSNITSIMMASQIERSPRAPSLNSTALSTI